MKTMLWDGAQWVRAGTVWPPRSGPPKAFLFVPHAPSPTDPPGLPTAAAALAANGFEADDGTGVWMPVMPYSIDAKRFGGGEFTDPSWAPGHDGLGALLPGAKPWFTGQSGVDPVGLPPDLLLHLNEDALPGKPLSGAAFTSAVGGPGDVRMHVTLTDHNGLPGHTALELRIWDPVSKTPGAVVAKFGVEQWQDCGGPMHGTRIPALPSLGARPTAPTRPAAVARPVPFEHDQVLFAAIFGTTRPNPPITSQPAAVPSQYASIRLNPIWTGSSTGLTAVYNAAQAQRMCNEDVYRSGQSGWQYLQGVAFWATLKENSNYNPANRAARTVTGVTANPGTGGKYAAAGGGVSHATGSRAAWNKAAPNAGFADAVETSLFAMRKGVAPQTCAAGLKFTMTALQKQTLADWYIAQSGTVNGKIDAAFAEFKRVWDAQVTAYNKWVDDEAKYQRDLAAYNTALAAYNTAAAAHAAAVAARNAAIGMLPASTTTSETTTAAFCGTRDFHLVAPDVPPGTYVVVGEYVAQDGSTAEFDPLAITVGAGATVTRPPAIVNPPSTKPPGSTKPPTTPAVKPIATTRPPVVAPPRPADLRMSAPLSARVFTTRQVFRTSNGQPYNTTATGGIQQGEYGGIRRATFLRFLASALPVPKGATVQSITLRLYRVRGGVNAPIDLTVQATGSTPGGNLSTATGASIGGAVTVKAAMGAYVDVTFTGAAVLRAYERGQIKGFIIGGASVGTGDYANFDGPKSQHPPLLNVNYV